MSKTDNDYETVSTVRVMRCKRTGEYGVHCDFPQHAEARAGFSTVGTAMQVAADILVEELRSRPTSDGLDPHTAPRAFVP